MIAMPKTTATARGAARGASSGPPGAKRPSLPSCSSALSGLSERPGIAVVLPAASMPSEVNLNAVPAIVINDRYLISGGQPPDAFEQALRGIAAELADA